MKMVVAHLLVGAGMGWILAQKPAAQAAVPGSQGRVTSRKIRLYVLPRDLECDAFGIEGESDRRQVLRSFFNMMIWGAVGVVMAIMLAR